MNRFKPYFRYLRPHRGTLTFAIFCGLIYGVSYGAGVPLMTKKVFPVIFGDNRIELSNLQLFLIALYLPGVFLLRGVAGYLNSYLIQLVGTRVLEAIRL